MLDPVWAGWTGDIGAAVGAVVALMCGSGATISTVRVSIESSGSPPDGWFCLALREPSP
jgi:hypothetical protein